MTAPMMPQQPQQQQAPGGALAARPGYRQRRQPMSPQGDGSAMTQGAQQMPQQGAQTQQTQPMQQQGGQRSATSHPPAPQSGGGAPAPPPTFAQMQANGQARPAPPPNYGGASVSAQQQSAQQGGGDALNSAVQQALSNPSAYGAPQVQQTYDMLNQQLGQDYDYQRKQLNDEMASRGLSASTIAGNRYSDLGTEQARAQSNLATQLATQAAQQYGTDRNAAIQSGLGLGNLNLAQQLGVGNLGIAQQNANTGAQSVQNQYSLGQGQLGLGAGELTGNYNGQQTLGSLQQQLAQQLGLGNLGVAQQQAQTGAQSVANQYQLGQGQLGLGQQQLNQQGSQFGQTLGENSRQFDLQNQLAQQLGLGNLGVAQQTANTGAQSVANQYNLGQAQLGQQGTQFNQTLGENSRQFDLQNQLAQQLGMGNLGVSQGQLNLAQTANQQQYGLAQQQQQLAQQLGLGNLGINQGQLDLARTNSQNQNAVDVGNLTGSYNGQQTLGAQQLGSQQSQFQQQLAQALQTATMQDKTANRGVDTQAALAQGDLMQKLLSLFAQFGVDPTPPKDPGKTPPPPPGQTPPPVTTPDPYGETHRTVPTDDGNANVDLYRRLFGAQLN